MKERVLAELRENFDGQPWHGSPLRRLLDGVDDAAAHRRSIPAAKTMAELLAHITAWIEIVARRAAGEVFEVTPAMDFPDPNGQTWSSLVAAAETAHAKLLEAVAQLDDATLRALVPDKPYTMAWMLDGLMHHNTYHGAQIALLKKY